MSRFARAAGDENPLHQHTSFRDASSTGQTRFRRPIASGPHTSALLMGLAATHFSRSGPMLGLEFGFRFRRPVGATDTVRLEWLVVAVRRSERLGGSVVELRGRLQNAAGETAVGAKGRVLLLDRT